MTSQGNPQPDPLVSGPSDAGDDFITRQFAQLKQKTSSADFLLSLEAELQISEADRIADKYAKLPRSTRETTVKFDEVPTGRLVAKSDADQGKERPPDEFECQIKELEAGFSRLAKLVTLDKPVRPSQTVGQPARSLATGQ